MVKEELGFVDLGWIDTALILFMILFNGFLLIMDELVYKLYHTTSIVWIIILAEIFILYYIWRR